MSPSASRSLGQVQMRLEINSVYVCVFVSLPSTPAPQATGQARASEGGLGGLGGEQGIKRLGLFPSEPEALQRSQGGGHRNRPGAG